MRKTNVLRVLIALLMRGRRLFCSASWRSSAGNSVCGMTRVEPMLIFSWNVSSEEYGCDEGEQGVCNLLWHDVGVLVAAIPVRHMSLTCDKCQRKQAAQGRT